MSFRSSEPEPESDTTGFDGIFRTMPHDRTRNCAQCHALYRPQRSSSRFCSERCRQRAHRSRLSVTSVTPAAAPIPAIVPSGTFEFEYRYVRHEQAREFTRQGWERLPALDGTHHGQYAALMRRRVEQSDDRARALIG